MSRLQPCSVLEIVSKYHYDIAWLYINITSILLSEVSRLIIIFFMAC